MRTYPTPRGHGEVGRAIQSDGGALTVNTPPGLMVPP